MSEQPNQPDRPEDEGARAGAGGDRGRPVERSGGGVTEGETTVDEAIGGEDDPAR
jgi:hypothetical protein